jgi:hypothetical protein
MFTVFRFERNDFGPFMGLEDQSDNPLEARLKGMFEDESAFDSIFTPGGHFGPGGILECAFIQPERCEEFYSGCLSMKELLEYFTPDAVELMTQVGYRVTVYETNYILQGRGELVFRLDKAIRRGELAPHEWGNWT